MLEYRFVSFPVSLGGLVRSNGRSALHPGGGALGPMVADVKALIVMLATVLVFIGGMIGTVWRFWWSGLFARHFGETFPFGTLAVNLVASILIGLVSGFLAHVADRQLATGLHQLLAVGVCGGLSTFSSFSLQTWNLRLERRWLVAILNMLVSTALCYAATVLGWRITG